MDAASAVFDHFESNNDVIWMTEVGDDPERVWTSEPRLAPQRIVAGP